MSGESVIYVDNNATTAVAPEVLEAMLPFLTTNYGNPGSIHTFGGSVAKDVENARLKVAELLNADHRNPDGEATEIIFTSCGTESDNAAIWSALLTNPERKKVIAGKVEHPAILNLGRELERRGYIFETIPVDSDGRIDLEALENALDDNTAVVSVMYANNEIGNIYPVEKIAEMAHRYGALFHTDAVQAVGKVPIDLANSQIDMLSCSGHKLHAPKGIGVLYVRRGIRFRPFIVGGHQEKARRGGTENVASIVALGKAAELAKANMAEEVRYLAMLRDRLEAGLLARIPRIKINGDKSSRLPNTSSVSFEFIEGEAILLLMNQFGICASSGSACTTGSLEPSHVLRAMGIPYTSAHGTIRFSFSRYNTVEEVDFILEKLPPIINTLRKLSPYWKEEYAQ
ncbi:MAG: cysteine desulfurase NifS [Lentisphaerae bacterium]|nr:cysteine desulfurase NifS [Lentisphaerota bacterium]